MAWIREGKRSWLQSLCIKTLKCGDIPNHLAVIMDGNRRFAKKLNLNNIQGHICGFDKLAETLDWCLALGINEVTVYAFSTENFKRSTEEVNALMELAREKFQNLLQEQEKLDKYGVCIRVYGDLTKLPDDIQRLIANAVLKTAKNDKAFLNVCLAYTARDEICHAVKEMGEGVSEGILQPEDVSEELLSQCLYTSNSPDPDLLVRTSGEVRLSDFLLWQSCFSVLAFFRVLWPEFSIWHLFLAIIFYQFNIKFLKKARLADREARRLAQEKEDYKNATLLFKKNCVGFKESDVIEYKRGRENRWTRFLLLLQAKRLRYFENLISSSLTQI